MNPYHVQVRSKNAVSDKYAKMSLQLYQVDYKSYLLDFKSLNSEENEQGPSKSRHYSHQKLVEIGRNSRFLRQHWVKIGSKNLTMVKFCPQTGKFRPILTRFSMVRSTKKKLALLRIEIDDLIENEIDDLLMIGSGAEASLTQLSAAGGHPPWSFSKCAPL